MAPTKYEKYVIQHLAKIDRFGPEIVFTGEEDYKSNFSTMFFHISESVLMEDSPHSHDCDIYLYFLGVDDMGDLGAEIDIGFGEEQEIHTITRPTSVYVPKGMVHCPLNFKRIDKPILFVHVIDAAKYIKRKCRPNNGQHIKSQAQ
jgi:hypothetical protein